MRIVRGEARTGAAVSPPRLEGQPRSHRPVREKRARAASLVSSLTVIVPALSRPRNVAPLVRSLDLSVARERQEGWKIDLLFVCSTDDRSEIRAVRAQGLEPLLTTISRDKSQYPKKINAGVRHTTSDWLFLGADDLEFHWGWLRAAVDAHIETGKLVVGTQDLGNQLVKRGLHATHSLVHRDYVELGTVDERGKLLHEGYDHNACDVEFIETAISRDQFVFADKAIVEHLHPLWHRQVTRDVVYRKGMLGANVDRLLLNRRRHMWGHRRDVGARTSSPGARPKRVLAVPRHTPRWPKQ